MKDMLFNDIEVGDIVLYTAPSNGRGGLPPMQFGEVVALTKAGVTVIRVDSNFNREQVEELVEDTSRPPRWIGADGHIYYEKVGSGRFIDVEPRNIRFYRNRFFIVRKI